MKINFFVLAVLTLLLIACGTTQPRLAGADELDMVIREASDYLNKNVPAGSKLVILNIKSNYLPLSEYIVDVLSENVVNDRVFTLVDRTNLALIQQEMDFQLSGEVSDESAQSIGQKLGAQTIISGSITPFGNLWRLTVRALGVESAMVQGVFNKNISNGASVAALTSGGPSAAALVVAPARPQAGAASAPAVPAPAPVTYKVGDTGPAGGLIFFDMGFVMDGWRYMEAAPQNFPTRVQWGDTGVLWGRTDGGIGTGVRNTIDIVLRLKQNNENTRAAQVVSIPQYGGFDDWFLPSKDELNLMYENLKKQRLGNFSNDVYWTSNNTDDYLDVGHQGVWQINFTDGRQVKAHYWNDALVRAARRF
jgi:TolB-like protein